MGGLAPKQFGNPRSSSSDRFPFSGLTGEGQWRALVSGPEPMSWQSSGAAACSLPGEKIILLTLASLTLTPLRHQHLALALGPGASSGATSGSETLIHRSQIWDPFSSVWTGLASLRDTDTCTYTEMAALRDTSRHTQTHMSTHTHSPSFFSSLPISFLGPVPLCIIPSFHKRAP